MTTLHLQGHISPDGQLHITLPEGLPPGKVQVTLELSADLPWEQQPWTAEELAELTAFKPATGAEIIAMLEESNGWWEDFPEDGAEWVQKRRQQQKQARQW